MGSSPEYIVDMEQEPLILLFRELQEGQYALQYLLDHQEQLDEYGTKRARRESSAIFEEWSNWAPVVSALETALNYISRHSGIDAYEIIKERDFYGADKQK